MSRNVARKPPLSRPRSGNPHFSSLFWKHESAHVLQCSRIDHRCIFREEPYVQVYSSMSRMRLGKSRMRRSGNPHFGSRFWKLSESARHFVKAGAASGSPPPPSGAQESVRAVCFEVDICMCFMFE